MPPKRRKRRARYVKIAKRIKTEPAVNTPTAPAVELIHPVPKWSPPPKETYSPPKMPVIVKPKQVVEDGEAVFERDNHGAFLSQSLNDLRKTNTMCDVMLRLPLSGRILQAHRLILRARSPFFRTVFENQVHRNCKNLVVSLPNYVRPAGVEPILDYIYTGLLKVSISTVAAIFQVAWLFKMEDVLAMCRQYCKTQRINPMQVNVMGDHCFLRRDVPSDSPVSKDNEIKKVAASVTTSPVVTTSANIVPSLGNLKTIFPPISLVTTQQNYTTISSNPVVSMALKVLATTTATTMTSTNISKQAPTMATAQPVQVMPSTLAIPNLPKQLTSLVGNNSVVVLSAGDVMYGGSDKNSPPIPKAVLEQLQALSKSSGTNKQRVFIVKTNSPRSLIKPASPETSLYKPSSNDVVTMDGPPEVIECTPSLPDNDSDTDSAEECEEEESPIPEEVDQQNEFSELKISNVTSVNDDDDVAPKFFPSAEEDKTGSENSYSEIMPDSSKSQSVSNVRNANKPEPTEASDDEDDKPLCPRTNKNLSSGEEDDKPLRPRACKKPLSDKDDDKPLRPVDCQKTKKYDVTESGDSSSSEGHISEQTSLIHDKLCVTNLLSVNNSNHSNSSETMIPDSNTAGDCNEDTNDDNIQSKAGEMEDSSQKPSSSSDVEESAVIIFRPKDMCNKASPKDESSKIIVKIDADKQHMHPVLHVLNATKEHHKLLLGHGFFHAQVHVNGKCQNVVMTADSDVQSLSIGNLNYVFPVEHTVGNDDVERFANIAKTTGLGWTTVGSLILKPSADELSDKQKHSQDQEITVRTTCDSEGSAGEGGSGSPKLSTNLEWEETKKILCTICNSSFTSLHGKSMHMLKHHRNKLHRDKDGIDKFVCEVCQYKCPSLRRMYFHRFYQHHSNLPDGVAQFRCGLCPSIEYSFVMLKNHYFRYHRGIKSFVCDYCGFTSKLMSTLQAHTKLLHSECPRFQCDLCGKNCRDRCNLENHRRTHTGEKTFKCPQCVYASAVQGNLKLHMVKVHNVKFKTKHFTSGKRKNSDTAT